MQSFFIAFKASRLHYRRYGSGSETLFCFHGYSRDASTFWFLERRLGDRFSIIAIDMPFHGGSEWREGRPLEPRELISIMHDIMVQHGLRQDKLTLLGFSMGGRVALQLTQLLRASVHKLVLLAPDGLNFSFWRWISANTFAGRQFIDLAMHRPGWVRWLLAKLERKGVIHRGAADFIRYYVDDDEQRKLFYDRYVSMRKFDPSLPLLRRLVRKYKLPVRMVFGSYDRVIPVTGGHHFARGLEDLVKVTVVESGHHLLNDMFAAQITSLINS